MTEQQAEYVTETQDGLDMFWNDKPRELPSVLSGFTPAPDALIKKYGFVTALVWGRIWRYCQMSDGVCRAKLEKISGEIGMNERTIIRHIEPLVEGGYLIDKTPNLRNKPHIYVDSGKIRIRISVEAAMTESQPAMTESQRQGDRESVEESIKKELKKQKKEGATPSPDKPKTIKANDFPSNVLFRSVTSMYPPKVTWHAVLIAVNEIEKRLGRPPVYDDLFPFYEAWCLKYNPQNMAWLMEWAVKGEIPSYKGNFRQAVKTVVNKFVGTPDQYAAAAMAAQSLMEQS